MLALLGGLIIFWLSPLALLAAVIATSARSIIKFLAIARVAASAGCSSGAWQPPTTQTGEA